MDDIRFTNRLIGTAVADASGGALGHLSALYADADTGEVVFGSVTMIRRGRRMTVFLPLDGAHLDGETITVRCGGQLVRRAPATHSGRLLPADSEATLYAHYDMAYTPALSASRRLLRTPH